MVEPDVGEVLPGGPGEVRVERVFEFVRPDLDTREAVVVANPELLEPPRPEKAFGLLDPR